MFGVALQYSGDESIDVPHSQRVLKTWDSSVYIATDQKGIIRSKRDIIDLFEYFVE
jgi:hypothetical protein